MADDQTAVASTPDVSDAAVLGDIATNGNLLNQNISALTEAVGNLASIVLPVPNGGTGRDALTIHNLLVGNGTDPVNFIAPSSTTGAALVSQGSSSDPLFGKVILTQPATAATLTIANNKTFTVSKTLTLDGTDSTTMTFPSTSGNVPAATSFGTSGQILVSRGSAASAVFLTFTDGIGGFLTFPTAMRYDIWLRSPFDFTITSTTTLCQAGSCTATWQVNTVNQGAPNAVSTSQVTNSQSISVAAGTTVNMTISSVSSCQGMSFMIAYTRAF